MTGEYLENFVEAMRSEKVREMRRNRTWSHHTDETKKKISEAGKGRKRSEETKQKMREVRMGKPMPKGHRENCIKAWEKRKLKK
jgi:Ni/Co efflux regulator RcnB